MTTIIQTIITKKKRLLGFIKTNLSALRVGSVPPSLKEARIADDRSLDLTLKFKLLFVDEDCVKARIKAMYLSYYNDIKLLKRVGNQDYETLLYLRQKV